MTAIDPAGVHPKAPAQGEAKSLADEPKARFSTVLAEFEKAAIETPAEKARRHVLERHHLSERAYAALPPDEKKAIDAEIAEAVKRQLTRRSNGPAAVSVP